MITARLSDTQLTGRPKSPSHYALQDYAEGPRWDNNRSFALSLVWTVRPWAFVRLGAVFVLNDSSIDTFNYNVFTGGPTASLNMQW